MDERVFDVSKPSKVAPDATSRPIIVGHHPMMNDPMMREDHPAPLSSHDDDKPLAPIDSSPVESTHLGSEMSALPSISEDINPKEPIVHPDPVPAPAPMAEPPGPDLTTPESQFINTDTTPAPQPPDNWHPEHDLPIAGAAHHHNGSGGSRAILKIIAVLVVLAAAYLIVDYATSVNLPLQLFKDKQAAAPAAETTQTTSPAPSPSPSAAALPAGFVSYTLTGTNLILAYPSAWGTPTTTPEMGYSKRGGTNKADVVYAYLVSFAQNKDVQIATTSSKYLPPARTALYYDFQQWCVGTADSKFYKQSLHFTTAAGVDTPTTAACDQGPLTDAVKVDEKTIVQAGAKAADGTVLGDVYTRNLNIVELPVMRVKDASAKNGDDIKKLLDNLQLLAPSASQ